MIDWVSEGGGVEQIGTRRLGHGTMLSLWENIQRQHPLFFLYVSNVWYHWIIYQNKAYELHFNMIAKIFQLDQNCKNYD